MLFKWNFELNAPPEGIFSGTPPWKFFLFTKNGVKKIFQFSKLIINCFEKTFSLYFQNEQKYKYKIFK